MVTTTEGLTLSLTLSIAHRSSETDPTAAQARLMAELVNRFEHLSDGLLEDYTAELNSIEQADADDDWDHISTGGYEGPYVTSVKAHAPADVRHIATPDQSRNLCGAGVITDDHENTARPVCGECHGIFAGTVASYNHMIAAPLAALQRIQALALSKNMQWIRGSEPETFAQGVGALAHDILALTLGEQADLQSDVASPPSTSAIDE